MRPWARGSRRQGAWHGTRRGGHPCRGSGPALPPSMRRRGGSDRGSDTLSRGHIRRALTVLCALSPLARRPRLIARNQSYQGFGHKTHKGRSGHTPVREWPNRVRTSGDHRGRGGEVVASLQGPQGQRFGHPSGSAGEGRGPPCLPRKRQGAGTRVSTGPAGGASGSFPTAGQRLEVESTGRRRERDPCYLFTKRLSLATVISVKFTHVSRIS